MSHHSHLFLAAPEVDTAYHQASSYECVTWSHNMHFTTCISHVLMVAGNDLNEETTPIEASLKWTIGKRRQGKFDFIGGDVIKKQIQDGIRRRRVGILSDGAPARAGAVIALPDGTEVCIPDISMVLIFQLSIRFESLFFSSASACLDMYS